MSVKCPLALDLQHESLFPPYRRHSSSHQARNDPRASSTPLDDEVCQHLHRQSERQFLRIPPR